MTQDRITLAVAVLALAGVLITGYLSRKSAKETNITTAWSNLAAAHQSEMKRLTERVDRLERDVQKEREERQSLANVLRSAWTHILRLGDQVRTLGGQPDPPPAELTAWMHQDGLVVDRVETRISRTTVVDTREHDDPLMVEDVSVDGE